MKQILIDDALVEQAKLFSENLFKQKIEANRTGRRNQFLTPSVKLNILLQKYQNDHRRILILRAVLYNYDVILKLLPSEMQRIVDYLEKKPRIRSLFYNKEAHTLNYTHPPTELPKGATTFSTEIFNALRYDALQASEAYKIYNITKIKVCPYCNAMLTVTINKKSKQKARFQLDHFFSKSKYPFLSTTFFNLIPCCNNCNQSKSNKDVAINRDFHLYSENAVEDIFKFTLNDADFIKSRIGISESDFTFEFNESASRFTIVAKNHNENYSIQSLYNTQKDIIAEMLWKYQTNPKIKLIELINLGFEESQIKRILLGNYSEFDDINKRPLAKFMQDIAKDIGLFDILEEEIKT